MIFLLLFLFFKLTWGNGFCYVQKFDITNPFSFELNDEDFILEINTEVLFQEGKLSSDCKDFRLRASNSTNSQWLDFWFETDCPNSESRLWSRIDLQANEVKILEVFYSSFDEALINTTGTKYEFEGEFYSMNTKVVTDATPFTEKGYSRVHVNPGVDDYILDRLLLHGNNFGTYGFNRSRMHSGNVDNDYQSAEPTFFKHIHNIPSGMLIPYGSTAFNDTSNHEKQLSYSKYINMSHEHNVGDQNCDPVFDVVTNFRAAFHKLPEVVMLELWKGNHFQLFPDSAFFTKDSSAEYFNAEYINEAEDRFVSFRRLETVDFPSCSGDIKVTGSNKHTHPANLKCDRTDVLFNDIDAECLQSPYPPSGGYINCITYRFCGAVDSYDPTLVDDYKIAHRYHAHLTKCNISNGESVPSHFVMKLLKHNQTAVNMDEISSDWIYLVDKIPPFGFVEVQNLPDSFIRVGKSNNFTVEEMMTHTHDVDCGYSGPGDVKTTGAGIAPWNLVITNKPNNCIMHGTFPLPSHDHLYEKTNPIFPTFVGKPDHGKVMFRYVQRKQNRVVINPHISTGEESLCFNITNGSVCANNCVKSNGDCVTKDNCTCRSGFFSIDCDSMTQMGLTVLYDQKVNPSANDGFFKLFTRVNYPFQLTFDSVVTDPSLVASVMSVFGTDCPVPSGDCDQEWINNIGFHPSKCDVSGVYTYRFLLNCRPGYSSCTYENETVDITTTIVSEEFCVQNETDITATMISCEDFACTTTKNGFLTTDTSYYEVTLNSDELDLHEGEVVSVWLTGSNVSSNANVSFLVEKNITVDGIAANFAHTTGLSPKFQFDVAILATGVYTVHSKIAVTYTFETTRRTVITEEVYFMNVEKEVQVEYEPSSSIEKNILSTAMMMMVLMIIFL